MPVAVYNPDPAFLAELLEQAPETKFVALITQAFEGAYPQSSRLELRGIPVFQTSQHLSLARYLRGDHSFDAVLSTVEVDHPLVVVYDSGEDAESVLVRIPEPVVPPVIEEPVAEKIFDAKNEEPKAVPAPVAKRRRRGEPEVKPVVVEPVAEKSFDAPNEPKPEAEEEAAPDTTA